MTDTLESLRVERDRALAAVRLIAAAAAPFARVAGRLPLNAPGVSDEHREMMHAHWRTLDAALTATTDPALAGQRCIEEAEERGRKDGADRLAAWLTEQVTAEYDGNAARVLSGPQAVVMRATAVVWKQAEAHARTAREPKGAR